MLKKKSEIFKIMGQIALLFQLYFLRDKGRFFVLFLKLCHILQLSYLELHKVHVTQFIPFCYCCTLLKQCDRVHSVPFYYCSSFCFVCRLRLNGTVSPWFF